MSLAFSPDDVRLASAGGEDTSIRVWDLLNPEAPPVKLMGHESAVYAVAFSPDGMRLASAGLNGAVRVWRMWSAAADYICTRVWRNLSMDEWRFYVGVDIPYEPVTHFPRLRLLLEIP